MTIKEINEKTVNMSLELEGKIFLVQKDEDGNILLREEIDGTICLQAILAVIDKTLKNS